MNSPQGYQPIPKPQSKKKLADDADLNMKEALVIRSEIMIKF